MVILFIYHTGMKFLWGKLRDYGLHFCFHSSTIAMEALLSICNNFPVTISFHFKCWFKLNFNYNTLLIYVTRHKNSIDYLIRMNWYTICVFARNWISFLVIQFEMKLSLENCCGLTGALDCELIIYKWADKNWTHFFRK